jgi:hypothetical protein
MSNLTEDEQDKGRNAVQCLEGFIVNMRKNGRITEDEKTLMFIWLKKIGDIFDGCKTFNKGEQHEKINPS